MQNKRINKKERECRHWQKEKMKDNKNTGVEHKKIDIVEIRNNKKFVSFAEAYPELAKSWDYELNKGLQDKNGNDISTPNKISKSSNQQVWWKCNKEEHSYQATVNNRSKAGCPYCSNRKLLVGFNDLATKYPELSKELHPTLNGNITASEIKAGGKDKIWWIGKCGHSFQAAVEVRIDKNGRKGTNCPYCAGQKLLPGFNDMATKRPDMAQIWHPTKNGELTPSDVFPGTATTFWWLGKCGHEWSSSANLVSKHSGCPYCSGQRVLLGFNDLATTHPHLAVQWHPTKNNDLLPIHVNHGSEKKVWWICDEGHEYETSIKDRTRGCSCPICSNHKIVSGINDLATTHPAIARQWHPTKNGDLKPTDVVIGSAKSAWWICDKGHDWEYSIRERLTDGCPYCSNSRAWPGYNDISVTHPRVAEIWHPTKNGRIKAENVLAYSQKKYWFLGCCGHEWKSSIATMVRSKTLCPYCANKRVLSGFNDLETKFPQIAAEWHPTLNNGLQPSDVLPGAYHKVWWKCENNHEWQAAIHHRTGKQQSGCPECARNYGASYPEKTVYYYIHKCFPDALGSQKPKWLYGREADILLPTQNVVIEYDGEYWHRNKQSDDVLKTNWCTKNGTKMIRIREKKLGLLNDGSKEYLVEDSMYKNGYQELHNIIIDIVKYLGRDPSHLDFTEYTYDMYLDERAKYLKTI